MIGIIISGIVGLFVGAALGAFAMAMAAAPALRRCDESCVVPYKLEALEQ